MELGLISETPGRMVLEQSYDHSLLPQECDERGFDLETYPRSSSSRCEGNSVTSTRAECTQVFDEVSSRVRHARGRRRRGRRKCWSRRADGKSRYEVHSSRGRNLASRTRRRPIVRSKRKSDHRGVNGIEKVCANVDWRSAQSSATENRPTGEENFLEDDRSNCSRASMVILSAVETRDDENIRDEILEQKESQDWSNHEEIRDNLKETLSQYFQTNLARPMERKVYSRANFQSKIEATNNAFPKILTDTLVFEVNPDVPSGDSEDEDEGFVGDASVESILICDTSAVNNDNNNDKLIHDEKNGEGESTEQTDFCGFEIADNFTIDCGQRDTVQNHCESFFEHDLEPNQGRPFRWKTDDWNGKRNDHIDTESLVSGSFEILPKTYRLDDLHETPLALRILRMKEEQSRNLKRRKTTIVCASRSDARLLGRTLSGTSSMTFHINGEIEDSFENGWCANKKSSVQNVRFDETDRRCDYNFESAKVERSTITSGTSKWFHLGKKLRGRRKRGMLCKTNSEGVRNAFKSPDADARNKKTSEVDSSNIRKEADSRDTSCDKSRSKVQEIRRITRRFTKINRENFVGKLVWGHCSGWWPALIIDAEHAGMCSEAGKLWVYWIGESRISLLNEKTQIEPFSTQLETRLAPKFSDDLRTQATDATIQYTHTHEKMSRFFRLQLALLPGAENNLRLHALPNSSRMLRERINCTLTKPYHSWIEKNLVQLNGSLDDMKFYPYPSKVKERLDFLKERNSKATEKYLLNQKRASVAPKKLAAERFKELSLSTGNSERLLLMDQKPGVIAWAKIAGHNWWPAMIIDYRDSSMREPNFGCQWIMWYGDYKLSEVHHNAFLKFSEGFQKMHDYIRRTKKHLYLMAVLHASKDYCTRLGCDTNTWTLVEIFVYFAKGSTYPLDESINVEQKIREKYTKQISTKLNELKINVDIDDKRKDDIKNSDAVEYVIAGKITLESLCLRCLNFVPNTHMEEHPFFKGSLCKNCSEVFKPCVFVFGEDGKCFYCTVCAGTGTVVMCDKEECPRVYCTACLKYLICPTSYNDILLEDPWECFLCKCDSYIYSKELLIPRLDWKQKMLGMFHTGSSKNTIITTNTDHKRKIRVLSLFDGLSTGLLVLLNLGLSVEVYYASEIDKDALMVSSSHFGNQIIQLGDIKTITKEKIEKIAPIDLLIGGSPCNDLSLANPARLGLYDPNGTGILFFEYCRILDLLKQANKDRKLFWLYENVASMPSEYRLEMNRHLGCEPDVIDSADFSPQHRLRLYWHNLPLEPISLTCNRQQDVQDILTPNCNRYALVKTIRTVTTKVNSLKQGKLALKPILMKDESDSLWITELEEIFGFPRHYTDVKNLSATKRQRLIGKSWSVQTLTAIFRPLCSLFEYKNTVID